MKYKIIEQTKNNIKIFCLYDDNTSSLLDLVAGRELEEILQDAYILTKNKENRQAYTGEELEDLKTYIPNPQPVRLEVDFYNLTGEVFDQYGDIIDYPIDFTIEGTDKAKIENKQVIEEEVDQETSYFLIARAGELEEKQERHLYPKPEPVEPNPEEEFVTKAEYDKLVEENKTLLKTQDDIMLAQAQMYEESEKRANEIMMAMAEIYESQVGGN